MPMRKDMPRSSGRATSSSGGSAMHWCWTSNASGLRRRWRHFFGNMIWRLRGSRLCDDVQGELALRRGFEEQTALAPPPQLAIGDDRDGAALEHGLEGIGGQVCMIDQQPQPRHGGGVDGELREGHGD